ncbi:CPCC family cysteine-rich protein [Dyella silvatica]|uniref:CPCC family cysteine-rich protein n=1 Tax=Dyella silvatica TaxID=2992128 RepID=UPI003CCE2142
MTLKDEAHMYYCPCCGSKTIDEPGVYEICDVCNWEDDPAQSSDPDYAGGANRISLNEAREIWLKR